MAVLDSEKLDQILKAYVLEVQSWANDNFKYAMARSCFFSEESLAEKTELVIVMYTKPQDVVLLSNRIAKLTTRYSRKYKIALQPAFQWEDEGRCEAVELYS